MDRISDLPDNVVDKILGFLPICEVVRTSTLSKKWQYKWITLSRICVGRYFPFHSEGTRQKLPPTQFVNLVKSILLQHVGPLLKFVINIPELDPENRAGINLIVRFALRNGAQELSVLNSGSPQALSSCLFSCAEQLRTLLLRNCALEPPLAFRGFPNLKILHLCSMCDNLERLSSFISCCPALEVITIHALSNLDQHLFIPSLRLETISITGFFRSISVQEVKHLVSLSIFLEDINHDIKKALTPNDYLLNIFDNLGNIKHLTLGGYIFELFVADVVPRKLAVKLNHLKCILLNSVDLDDIRNFLCLLCLIGSSPNLEQLTIRVGEINCVQESHCIPETTDCVLDRLRTITIEHMIGTKSELVIIEFLLGRSPVLEVMSIQLKKRMDNYTKLEVSKELMRFRRASPMAQLFCSYDKLKTK